MRAIDSHRMGAAGGVLFVVLVAAAAVAGGTPPAASDSDPEITSYLVAHEFGLRAGIWLLGLGIVPLLWWFASLWRTLVGGQQVIPGLALISLAGLSVAGPLALTSSVILAVASTHTDGSATIAPALYSIASMLLAAEGFGLATHLLASNVLGLRTRTLPLWLAACGFGSALLFLAAGVLSASGVDANSSLGLIAFVLWCAWILCVSYSLWIVDCAAVESPAVH